MKLAFRRTFRSPVASRLSTAQQEVQRIPLILVSMKFGILLG